MTRNRERRQAALVAPGAGRSAWELALARLRWWLVPYGTRRWHIVRVGMAGLNVLRKDGVVVFGRKVIYTLRHWITNTPLPAIPDEPASPRAYRAWSA